MVTDGAPEDQARARAALANVGGCHATPLRGRLVGADEPGGTMHTIVLVLLIVSALSFGAAVVGVRSRVDLVALGLLAWVLTVLLPQLG